MISALQAINYIIDQNDFSIVTINNLNKTFFTDYEEEFEFIRTHYTEYGNVPDKLTFYNAFPDFDVMEVKESPQFIVNSLYADYNKRQLAKTFNKIKKSLTEDNLEEAFAEFKNSYENLSSGVSMNTVDILHNTDRYAEYVDRMTNYENNFLTTGFPELDKIMGGWERKEEYANIVARSGSCKSWCLLKCAIAAAEKGLRVGMYSGEMSESKVGFRADSLIGHMSSSKLMHGNEALANDYKNYIDDLPHMFDKGCLKILTPASVNGPVSVSTLRAFIEKDKLDALYIDQHSLLFDERRGRTPSEQAANISKDIKNLQVIKQIPIICVSQLNRSAVPLNGGGDTTTTAELLATISNSDRIAQDSTTVIALDLKDGVITMQIIKSRDMGGGSKLTYRLDFEHGVFQYIPVENDGVSTEQDMVNMYNEFEGSEEF